MNRTAIISPGFLKPLNGVPLTLKQKKDIVGFMAKQPATVSVSKDIEQFMQRLNAITSYSEIPDTVIVGYNGLIERNLNFKDAYDLLKLTLKITANRLAEKPKECLITGTVGDSISNTHYESLVQAGFVGCSLSPKWHGIDAAQESIYLSKKDPSHWSLNAVVDKKIKLATPNTMGIALTFRQEQIYQMICTHGMTNHQIAKRLGISESTVKLHIGIVLKKYNAQHRSQLIIMDKQPRL